MRVRGPFIAWLLALVIVFWFAAEATLSTTWTSVECRRSAQRAECVFETASLTGEETREVPVEQIGGAFVEAQTVAWRRHWRLWVGTGIGAVPVSSLNEDRGQVAYLSHRFGEFLEEPRQASFYFEEALPWGTWGAAFTALLVVLLLPLAWLIGRLIAVPEEHLVLAEKAVEHDPGELQNARARLELRD